MDIISRCDSSLKDLVITASRNSKDKVRQLISNCIASLRNIKNLQSCSTFLDEFLSHAQILAKCRPNDGNHAKNVNDFLEFGKFLLESIDISKDQKEVQSARALYHACLSITQEQTDHYSFIFYPPYTHEIFEYPSVYTFNYEYRDRILIPLFKLTDTKTNFIIFTSDDESLIHENALWFYNQYTELDIVTDLNSLQTAFNEDRKVLAFISVFDATTFMIQNNGKKTPKMMVVYHAIDHKNIKFFSILDVVRKIRRERRLKFILSLANPINVGFEVSETEQLNINLEFSQKSQIEALSYATNNRNRYGSKIVYFVDSLFDVQNIINEYQKQTSNLTVISPEKTPETSAKDILSLCQNKSCLIPLFSNIKSHLNLFNTQNPNSSIFVLFVFGDTQSSIMNCSFAINGCKNDMNYMYKISNVHGNYNYLVLESAEQRTKTREERNYDTIIEDYLNDDEFEGFHEQKVSNLTVLNKLIQFLSKNYMGFFTDFQTNSLMMNANLDSDFITIINCLSQIFESNENNRILLIKEIGISLRKLCQLELILTKSDIRNLISLKNSDTLHDQINAEIVKQFARNKAKRSDVSVFQKRPGFSDNFYPENFYYLCDNYTFIHSTDKNNYTFIDCPGCVHSAYFTMIFDMVYPNMKLKVYQNKIVIEDQKMRKMIEKTVKDIASIMPFVGETLFAIEIMNNISLELISIGDQFFTRLLETNSLFFYKFDKHCFDYCLKNINLLNDPGKSLRISYVDKILPLLLVSDKDLKLPSQVIHFTQNPKIEYVCDLRELSQLEKCDIELDDGEIAVDEVIFNPPASKFHPSLFNSEGAVEFLLEYLREHDIICFPDNNKIGMSWRDAQKARNILEEDEEFNPPFKTLNINKDASLSLVISKTSEISPYWVVDSQRKLLIVPEYESETAKSILSDFVYENEIEDFDDVKVFGCTDMCTNPEESKNYIVAYDVKNNTSQAKHFCLTCLEKFLHDAFNENKGNTKYNQMPRAINFEGYSPIGQMFFSLSDEKVYSLMQRWLKSVIIVTLHTSPGKIYFCPDHEETVYDFKKNLECPICHKRFCNKCMTHHNKGEICKKDLEENLPETDMMKKCPRCGIMVFKESGCNRLTCRCGASFCWRCKACFNSEGECYAHLRSVHGGCW